VSAGKIVPPPWINVRFGALFGLRVQPVSATPLVVYRLAFLPNKSRGVR
jgi:hypothetical protein